MGCGYIKVAPTREHFLMVCLHRKAKTPEWSPQLDLAFHARVPRLPSKSRSGQGDGVTGDRHFGMCGMSFMWHASSFSAPVDWISWPCTKKCYIFFFSDRMSSHFLAPGLCSYCNDSKTQVGVCVNKQRRGKVPEIPVGCPLSPVYRIVPPRICDMTENTNLRV